MNVISSDPVLIYFEGSVSLELGMGYEREIVKADSKLFGLGN